MKMKLVPDVSGQFIGKVLWKPEDNDDLPTFMHVCNGMIAVTEDHLMKELIPLFKRHGIEVVLMKN